MLPDWRRNTFRLHDVVTWSCIRWHTKCVYFFQLLFRTSDLTSAPLQSAARRAICSIGSAGGRWRQCFCALQWRQGRCRSIMLALFSDCGRCGLLLGRVHGCGPHLRPSNPGFCGFSNLHLKKSAQLRAGMHHDTQHVRLQAHVTCTHIQFCPDHELPRCNSTKRSKCRLELHEAAPQRPFTRNAI